MAKKIAFSPAPIDALQQGLLPDFLTPGLSIEVLASGKKRWRYRRQIAGTRVAATLFLAGDFELLPSLALVNGRRA